ncbi:hypothetical protein LJU32_14805 [Pseudomonas sp. B21_DOA]|nr:hypothetical protein LJU32_14805 [Pseudomonas sp. B21_DOA]
MALAQPAGPAPITTTSKCFISDLPGPCILFHQDGIGADEQQDLSLHFDVTQFEIIIGSADSPALVHRKTLHPALENNAGFLLGRIEFVVRLLHLEKRQQRPGIALGVVIVSAKHLINPMHRNDPPLIRGL